MADKWTPKEKEYTPYANQGVLWLSDKFGLNMGELGTELAGGAVYSIPVLGNVLAAADAVREAKNGNYGEAALNAVMALPLAGWANTGLKLARTAGKLGKTGKIFTTTTKALSAVNRAGDKYSKLGYYIPASMVAGYMDDHSLSDYKSMYDNWVNGGSSSPRTNYSLEDYDFYKGLKTRIELNIKDARSKGYSEDEIKSVYGDSWNEVLELLNTNF